MTSDIKNKLIESIIKEKTARGNYLIKLRNNLIMIKKRISYRTEFSMELEDFKIKEIEPVISEIKQEIRIQKLEIKKITELLNDIEPPSPTPPSPTPPSPTPPSPTPPSPTPPSPTPPAPVCRTDDVESKKLQELLTMAYNLAKQDCGCEKLEIPIRQIFEKKGRGQRGRGEGGRGRGRGKKEGGRRKKEGGREKP